MNNTNQTIFISHASADKALVNQLREILELYGQSPWVDSRELVGGDVLNDGIFHNIAGADCFIVLLSSTALASEWVRGEVSFALQQVKRRGDAFKLVPVVLPEVDKSQLNLLFEQQPLYIFMGDGPAGLDDAMPKIFSALGLQLPRQWQNSTKVTVKPIDELVFKLVGPFSSDGLDAECRATATAQLSYYPAFQGHVMHSEHYSFVAPLGAVELEQIRWYIESYFRWPTGVFKMRAGKIEQVLPQWGNWLFKALLGDASAVEVWQVWSNSVNALRFSVLLDFEPSADAAEQASQYQQAASSLLSLPWEILHDGDDYLFQGVNEVQVRRRLPSGQGADVSLAENHCKPSIRVLLLSPRPEIDETGRALGYLDHRSSALPLIQAVENLGQALVKVDILHPPTFAALKKALRQAKKADDPYDIVHFDGHGVFESQRGLGALCFEDPAHSQSLGQRLMQLVDATTLAAELRRHNIPLVYLDACQTAYSRDDPQASVAATLLQQGVTCVVAMTHTVLVETARRFVESFYRQLVEGQRVGDAMLAARMELFDDSYRSRVTGAGRLTLQDWFVPVLYQGSNDPQLFNTKAGEPTRWLIKNQRQLQLGRLPSPPDHAFVGRSRVLLQLERLLQQANYAVIRGGGGMGKTTVAVELARWLVRCEQYQRVAFVSVESQNVQDIKGVLDSIGHQLLPKYTVAQYGDDLAKALQPIERALLDFATIIVIDNMESVLPDHHGLNPAGVADVTELLALCQKLLSYSDSSRVIFTSRESLPKPFANAKHTLTLGRLSELEAIELVEKVMVDNDWNIPFSDNAMTADEVNELVKTVDYHPRALVLLAREVASGVRATTENLAALMAKLEAQNPGDRENSLYASVELSLRRLPDDVRVLVERLAVFYAGGQLGIIAAVMGVDELRMAEIADMLVEVGLAELMDYGYLRLDPALPLYLQLGQIPQDLIAWAIIRNEGLVELVEYLYEQKFADNILATNLTLLELPNLLVLLDALLLQAQTDYAMAQGVSTRVGKIEQLLSNLARPQALAQAAAVRKQVDGLILQWCHASFENERLVIERLVRQEQLALALEKAEILLQKSKQTDGYQGADYDLATAHFLLARVHKKIGNVESALESSTAALLQFQLQGSAAASMVSLTLTEQGDCLTVCGRFEQAREKYQQAIDLDEKHGSVRGVAVGKTQLAILLSTQGQHLHAIDYFAQTLDIFKQQNEPKSMASVLHQMATAQIEVGQFDAAEKAYRQSLEIKVQINDKVGQADSLAQLGNLYGHQLGLAEEALAFYQQAADIFVELECLLDEGAVRNNIALIHQSLGQYNAARAQVNRAIECFGPFGHPAQPWTAFSVLHQIEADEGNEAAAKLAWIRARDSYLAYRLDGGEAKSSAGGLVDNILLAMTQGDIDEMVMRLEVVVDDESAAHWYRFIIAKVLMTLKGEVDHALALDTTLDYSMVAEVLFFIQCSGQSVGQVD